MEVVNEKSCGIVIYCKNGEQLDFLILHYPEGHWDFPKGHVEDGESEHQTALRELEEETGLTDAKLHPEYRMPINYEFRYKNKLIKKEVVFFLAEVDCREIEISHEHRDHQWKAYDEAYKQVTFQNAKDLLSKAKEMIIN